MLASAHHWDTRHYLSTERERIERERKLVAAKDRRAHRALDRRARLLKDLEAVHVKLRALMGARVNGANNSNRYLNLLRRRNKLVDALNAQEATR